MRTLIMSMNIYMWGFNMTSYYDCPNCGGELELGDGAEVYECPLCNVSNVYCETEEKFVICEGDDA